MHVLKKDFLQGAGQRKLERKEKVWQEKGHKRRESRKYFFLHASLS